RIIHENVPDALEKSYEFLNYSFSCLDNHAVQ
ncbi:MAG: hypothetical protein ACJATI_005319, partial [Halioglobus sp.]